jgi:Ca2+-binding EF-hand superfamily protein
MDQLKKQFEKDLKTKLLYKTSLHMTEEILLLKNFKYFDEDNSNKCDAPTFFKVISKVGVFNLSEDQLYQLFDYYSNGQKYLNYKDFIGEVFNNESLKTKKQKPNEIQKEEKEERSVKNEPQSEKENEEENENEKEEEMDPIDELILRLRNRLAKRGLSNFIKMEGRCRELDENNEQELDIKQFAEICDEFDFGLTDEEIEDLFASFDKDEKGTINYDDFIRIFRGELNEKRKDLVQNVFKHLDVDNKGEIPLDELLSLYNPQQSLEYLKQKKTEDEAMRIFEESLRGNHKYLNGDEGDTKPVDNEEFEDFYESVSMMIPSDELFRDVILRTWGLIKDEPREEENDEEPQENEDVQDRRRPPREEYDEESRENPQDDRDYLEEMEPEPEQEDEYEERPPVKKLRDKEKEFKKNILNEDNIDRINAIFLFQNFKKK